MTAIAFSSTERCHEAFRAFMSSHIGTDCNFLKNASILECMDALIKTRERRNPKYGDSFLTTRKTLNQLQFLLGGQPIKTNMVNEKFWDFFISISSERLAMSTVKRSVQQLISLLTWASKYGAELQPDYDSFRLKSYTAEHICLSVSEVSQLYNYNFHNHRINGRKIRADYADTLHKVVCMFVLACNLGQRYSDMIRIDRGCFDSGVFSIMQQKTGNVARLRMIDMCLDFKITMKILEEFDYTPPITWSNNTLDRYLKKACEYAGLTDEIRLETRRGSLSTYTTKKMFEVVSMHTARRTFISYNIKRGVNIETVKRASGHSSLSSLSKYIVYKD